MRFFLVLFFLVAAASLPLMARDTWVEVKLPDGRKGWAPMQSVLVPAATPREPARVLDVARRMMGAPYRWGGVSPNGADCSGFVQEVFRLAGHRLPRLADEQFLATAQISADEMRPGDLVFFTTYLPGPSHVGIYLGDGRFVHASSSRGVVESGLDEHYYKTRYLGAHRPLVWLLDGPAPQPTPEAADAEDAEDETAMP